LDGLARIGSTSSIPVFNQRLTDRDQFIRRAAAEGLGRAGDTSVVPALQTSIGNESSEMVRAAIWTQTNWPCRSPDTCWNSGLRSPILWFRI
jgi:hypothetical protein